LARTVSNAGVEPNAPASTAMPKLQEYTGGHAFDPRVGKYWEYVKLSLASASIKLTDYSAWIARDSFKKNEIK
jgi:hypothetical protein